MSETIKVSRTTHGGQVRWQWAAQLDLHRDVGEERTRRNAFRAAERAVGSMRRARRAAP